MFYGLGNTIGAGIYVLIGETAGLASFFAPFAFILSLLCIFPTAISYAKLSKKFPISTGEVAFVRFGLKNYPLSVLTGLIIFGGFGNQLFIPENLERLLPPLNDFSIWEGILNASVIAVFAFLGFESLSNVSEEVKKPDTNVPRAIFITLIVTTVLYILVMMVSLFSIGPAALSISEAPLSAVYLNLTKASPIMIAGIAIFATLNTLLVQYIVISRIIYGMTKDSRILKTLAVINPQTRTPINATILVVAITLILAFIFPLDQLAKFTSQVVLCIWILVNVSLINVHWHATNFKIRSLILPTIGMLLAASLLIFSLL